MASTVRSFPEVQRMKAKRGRPSLYPWDKWFNGRIWKLKQGEDFSAMFFQSQAHTAARTRGVKLKTRMVDGDLYIQALAD